MIKWKSLSRVWLFATPWTIQSMELSRPEYWSGQPFPSSGDLPNPGIEPRSPALQVDALLAEPPVKPRLWLRHKIYLYLYIYLYFNIYTHTHTHRLLSVTLADNPTLCISYYVKNDCMFIVLRVSPLGVCTFLWGELWGTPSRPFFV